MWLDDGDHGAHMDEDDCSITARENIILITELDFTLSISHYPESQICTESSFQILYKTL